MSRSLSALTVALLVLIATSAAVVRAQTTPIQYGYDELGRLIVVVDQSGNTAIYSYDLVGNLLSIERIDPNQLPGPVAITYFTPQAAKVGATVSIFGKGFGATPGLNTVSFNGGTATVTSASANRLIVSVPSTALTGPITVTAPLGAATSSTSFRVIGALSVTPTTASVNAGGTLQFTVTGPGGFTPPVTWAVNGITSGNANIGTITSAGLYTAPSSLPQAIAVTISATDSSDPTTKATASATVVATGTTLFAAAKPISAMFPQRLAIIGSVGAAVSSSFTPMRSEAHSAAVSGYFGGEPAATTTSRPVTATFEPFITAVSPATITRGASNATVTLSGFGFDGASGVAALLGQTADTNVTISIESISADGTQVTLMVSVTSTATIGARVMQITTPNGTSTAVTTGVDVLTVQ